MITLDLIDETSCYFLFLFQEVPVIVDVFSLKDDPDSASSSSDSVTPVSSTPVAPEYPDNKGMQQVFF